MFCKENVLYVCKYYELSARRNTAQALKVINTKLMQHHRTYPLHNKWKNPV